MHQREHTSNVRVEYSPQPPHDRLTYECASASAKNTVLSNGNRINVTRSFGEAHNIAIFGASCWYRFLFTPLPRHTTFSCCSANIHGHVRMRTFNRQGDKNRAMCTSSCRNRFSKNIRSGYRTAATRSLVCDIFSYAFNFAVGRLSFAAESFSTTFLLTSYASYGIQGRNVVAK